MKFKPVTEKYQFNDSLVHDYPEYLQASVQKWIEKILTINRVLIPATYHEESYLKNDFIEELNLHLREKFPKYGIEFLFFIFSDKDRTTNFLGLCLQNYADKDDAEELELILSKGGSAFSVVITQNTNVLSADLVQRVPSIMFDASDNALNSEQLLKDAWVACYSRNPDYDKTVSKSVDVLEGIFKSRYFPLDPKPVLTKFINSFATNPNILSYKGSTLVSPKNNLTNLAKEFIKIRGQHTNGNGRSPTKDEAEFVLHYVIFIWNMYR